VSRPALVVLDLVGTTVRADDAVPNAFAAALAAEGVSVTPAQLHAVRGATKRIALERLLPDVPDRLARAERAYARFRAELLEAYAPGHVSEVPGAARLVQRLRAAGVRVVLNTGFDRALTSHLLAVLGWQALADAVICGDDVPEGRPAPYLIFRAMEATATTRLREVANVGDTTLDLQAADNAGTGWNIGVWSGAHDRATLAAAPHSHLCCSVADVGIVLEVL
jgi:phosphonatase-like hydrolase